MSKKVKVDLNGFEDAILGMLEDGIGDVLEDNPVSVKCPGCGTRFDIREPEAACPKCGHLVKVQVG